MQASGSATRRNCCGALQFLLYSYWQLLDIFLKKQKLEERKIMKIAMRVTLFAAMLVAGTIVSGSMGQPVPFPIPPTQMSQSGSMGQPVPFPIPPAGPERV